MSCVHMLVWGTEYETWLILADWGREKNCSAMPKTPQPARGCFVPPQNLVGGGYRWQMGPVTYKRHSQFSVHICREDIQLQAQKQLRMAWLKITLLLFVYLEGSGEIIMILLRLCITKWFFFSMLQWGLLMMTIPPAALTSAFNVNGLQDVSDAPRAVSLWYFFFL